MRIRINPSKRGLTFSFQKNETFDVGTKYRYVLDVNNNDIIIVPDEFGKYKLSKKGEQKKPLIDLRNVEIKEAISMAKYMEIEILDDKIIVHVIKKEIEVEGLTDREIISLLDKEDKITFEVSKEDLKNNHEALNDMLVASGLFSEKVREDISYVYDFGSLFSGGGLFELPFIKDGSFESKFGIDFDKSACDTYKKNINDNILCMDIRDLQAKELPDVDLIIGSPCCQGYSNANRKGNLELDKGKRELINDFIRIIKGKKPLIFLLENVPQFVTKENGRYLERLLLALSEYNISYSIVNDNEVGGYTTRKRMILIGSRIGRVNIPDIELYKKMTSGDALKKVNSSWFHYDDITKPSKETQRKMSYVKIGNNYKDIPEMQNLDRHSNVYRRLDPNKPSVTITNWRKVNLMPPIGNRILSVAEASALMGLDGSFELCGSLNDKQQIIGNGVSQSIARFCKDIIKNALYRYSNQLVFGI